jgi:predicted transposase/invertase (TIGR01784 family)
MLSRKHPELKEAVPCVNYMSFGEQWRWKMIIRQMWKRNKQIKEMQFELDLAKAHAKGHAEGMEKGLAKGFAEGTLEITRKMKKAGRPFSEIAEFTGLTVENVIRCW